jgi:hypothetical protein
VTITHPYHKLKGQSFQVLKQRRVAGVETLVLRGSSGGTFAVAREWTDAAEPTITTGVLQLESLVTLIGLVDDLKTR